MSSRFQKFNLILDYIFQSDHSLFILDKGYNLERKTEYMYMYTPTTVLRTE